MFDKLVDVLLQWLDLFAFVRIVHTYEKAVVLRLGRYHRTLEPGWHFVLPFRIEETLHEHVVPTTTNLAPQSLTTADDVSVVCAAVVTWQVRNVRKILLECEGKEQVMLDACAGVIAQHVTGATWRDLTTDEFARTVTSDVRSRAKKWGIRVIQVQFTDVAKCRAYRLVSSSTPQVY